MKNLIVLLMFISLVDAKLIKNGSYVSDSFTNLQWQDNITQSFTLSWEESINYCTNLILNDKDDWRLPNINELSSLVDESRLNPASSVIFETMNGSLYWSSTTSSTINANAWSINFYDGLSYHYDKNHSQNIRCVRTAQ
jgi:hypothetical protein